MPETRLEIVSLQSAGGKDEGSQQITVEDAERLTDILNCKVPLASWLKCIMAEVKQGGVKDKQPGEKIPEVNEDVIFKGKVNKQGKGKKQEEESERTKDESFVPCEVSIGPRYYFDRQDKLSEVEKLKVPMACQFIRDSKKLNKDRQPDVERFYEKVKEKAELAMGFYDTNSTKWFDDEQFTKMMFLDGCFILQFIHCVAGGYEKEKERHEMDSFYQKLKNLSDRQVADVKRDLLLLENQLPFPILDALLKERYKEGEGMDRIDKFLAFHDRERPLPMWFYFLLPFLLCLYIFCCWWYFCPGDDKQPTSGDNRQSVSDDDRQYDHLLGYLYLKFTKLTERDVSKLTTGSGKPVYEFISGSGKRKLSLGTRGHYLYYSAKDLKKVGIHFRPSFSSCLQDVEFKPKCCCGILTLPPITIDHSTKSMLLNLMAFEAAELKDVDVAWVRSYVFFMDSLIDDAEDVKELRSKGIISNYLGSEQRVADQFNSMTDSLVEPDYRAYNDIKKKINMQCNNRFKICVADTQHKYFSSPWSPVALTAAAFTIFLTAVATYIEVWPNN